MINIIIRYYIIQVYLRSAYFVETEIFFAECTVDKDKS